MIVRSSEADRYITRAPGDLAAALVFGPDQGLVRERADALGKSVVPDLKDPFRVADLDEPTLATDGARLFDEVAAISMLGGRRVVRVRTAGNTLASLFEAFLDDPKGDALVVVEAGDLSKASPLRKVFETADNAAAIQCYGDSAERLADVLRRALKADGISIGAEALDDAVARLGSDRGITRREIEKLALYVGVGNAAGIADVRAILGDETEGQIEDICDAAGEGSLARLDPALERVWSEGTTAIAILRAVISHFQRLLAMQIQTAHQNIETSLRSVRPPIHFTRVASFKTQISRWNPADVLQALSLLFEAEVLCKSTAIPAESVCARVLYRIAAMARLASR